MVGRGGLASGFASEAAVGFEGGEDDDEEVWLWRRSCGEIRRNVGESSEGINDDDDDDDDDEVEVEVEVEDGDVFDCEDGE